MINITKEFSRLRGDSDSSTVGYQDDDLQTGIDNTEAWLDMLKEDSRTHFIFDAILHARSIADIGCGYGSLGVVLNKLGSRARLVGIDAFSYHGKTGHRHYKEVIKGDITRPDVLSKLNKQEYNLVLGLRPYPSVAQFMRENSNAFSFQSGGRMIIAQEGGAFNLDLIEGNGFVYYPFDFSPYQHIFIKQF